MAGELVQLEAERVNAFLTQSPRLAARAMLRGIKRGGTAARTAAARVTAKDTGLRVAQTRKAIKLIPPNERTFTAELRASLTRVPLHEFSAKGPYPSRGKGRGVSYRGKGGGRRRIRQAFRAFSSSSRVARFGVFVRKGKARTPTTELRGPSIGRVMDLHRDAIIARGVEVAENEISRLVERGFAGAK